MYVCFLWSSEKELELPVAASGAVDPEKMVSEVAIQFSNFSNSFKMFWYIFA